MLLMFALFGDDFSRIRHQHSFNNDSQIDGRCNVDYESSKTNNVFPPKGN